MTVLPPLHTPGGPEGRWHYRRSLASRVTVLTTIAAGATVMLVAFGAYVTVRMQMQATLDDSLVHRAQSTPTAALCDSDFVFPADYFGATNVWVACLDSSGNGLVRGKRADKPQDLIGAPEVAVSRGEKDSSVRTTSAEGTQWRIAAVRRDDGSTMVIGQTLDSQQAVLGKLGIVMFLFGLAGVIASGMAGWAVARNGLRPVRRLTTSVEEVARTEDLRPMPVEGDDEIARLTTAFNQMLAALAASRDRQRQLVADAGHELRTPLTSLRTNLDLLSQADSAGGLPPGAKEELLDDVRAQIEEMTTLIGDLVELSRDEPLTHVVEEIDLADLVDRTVSRARRRAPGVTFETDLGRWYLVGEQAGIERAVMNLLDNAAKWSPSGGTVTVHLADGELIVDDQGPGIPEEDRPHVFDRFFRSAESRAMPGSGLGLSIVRQVAERHSGTVEAMESPAGGARLVLWLPGSISPVPDWTPTP